MNSSEQRSRKRRTQATKNVAANKLEEENVGLEPTIATIQQMKITFALPKAKEPKLQKTQHTTKFVCNFKLV